MRTTIGALALATTLALSGAAWAGEPGWIHVEVKDSKSGDARVSVNLPIALLDLAVNSMGNGRMRGHVHMGEGEVGLSDIRKMWTELKKAGDAPFVTVDKEDESVRIERRGAHMLLQVTDKRHSRDKVRMDVPTSVVDALLSGETDSLNLVAAANELRRAGGGELIRIDDEDSHVRVWLE
jgi:hypothetical protein